MNNKAITFLEELIKKRYADGESAYYIAATLCPRNFTHAE